MLQSMQLIPLPVFFLPNLFELSLKLKMTGEARHLGLSSPSSWGSMQLIPLSLLSEVYMPQSMQLIPLHHFSP